jgi:glycosyltransferase involved in cell wall biosynthesis
MRTLISLLLPTRGRPLLARRFLQSVAEQSAYPDDVEIILYADEDDTASHGIDYPGLKIHRIIGPRRSMGTYNSACLAASKGEIIALVNDDMVIRTHGWDEKLRQLDSSIADRIYLAYGNDLFKKDNLCTFPILSRHVCDVLQEPFHKAYRGAFIDYHLMDIFKRLLHDGHARIFYLADVVFEHLHYRTGKAEKDATYTARGRFDDDMIFLALAPVRRMSAHALKKAIGNGTGSVSLPPYESVRTPVNPWRALLLFSRAFLFDKDLPFGWRFFLWWWFSARFSAHRFLRNC